MSCFGSVQYICHEKKSIGTSLFSISAKKSFAHSVFQASAGPPIFSSGKQAFKCFAAISYKNVYNADFKDENNVYKESFVLLVLFVALIQTVSQFGFCKNCQKYFQKFEQIYVKVEEPIYILPQNKIFDDVNEDELPVFQNYVRPSMYPAFSIVLSKDYDIKSIVLPSGDSPDVQGLNYYNDIAIDNEFNRVMFFYSFYDMKNKDMKCITVPVGSA